MEYYVLGFAFSPNLECVYLIKKARPEWQAGKFNGIGGKKEPGENYAEAMVREFEEETTVRIEKWYSLGMLTNSQVDQYCCSLFWTILTPEQFDALDDVIMDKMDEKFYAISVKNLAGRETIPNVPALVSCALLAAKDRLAHPETAGIFVNMYQD